MKFSKGKIKPFVWLPIGVGIVCVIIIAAAVLFLRPEETKAEKLQEQLALGNKFLENADFESARVAFDTALEIDEKSPDAALGLAKVFNEQGDPDQAFEYLQKASDNLKVAPEVTLTDGNTGTILEDYPKEFNKTIELFEDNGNENRANEAREQAADIIIYIEKYYVVVSPAPTLTPTPQLTPVEEASGGDDTRGDSEITVTPIEEAKPTVTPIDDPVIIITEEPTVTPTIEIPQETPKPTPEEIEPPVPGSEEIDGIPPASEDGTYNPEELEPQPTPVEESEPSQETPEELEPQPTPAEESEPSQEVPEETEPQPTPEEEPVPDELMQSYIDTVLLTERSRASFSGTAVNYDYSAPSTAASALNGILGIHKADVNWDGSPEMLVVSMENGKIAFSIYMIKDGNVEQTSSVTAVCDGMGTALSGMTYGSTQECFIKDDGSSFYIGIASYCFGIDKGDGNPAAQTSAEVYQIDGEGNALRLNAVTIQNGTLVYTDGDPSTASEGGKDMFISTLAGCGLSGNWISGNADTLLGMDLINNPQQDMAVVPNPIGGGIGAVESGVQDLVIVTADMEREAVL